MKFRRTNNFGKFEVKKVKIREQWANMSFVSRSLHASLKWLNFQNKIFKRPRPNLGNHSNVKSWRNFLNNAFRQFSYESSQNSALCALIGRSLSLPWLFSRQTKLRETSSWQKSVLEKGECVREGEYLRDAWWDKELGCLQWGRWKRDEKRITSRSTCRSTPWKRSSWFFLDHPGTL